MKIVGTFDVNLKPLDFSVPGQDGNAFQRMSINKKFNGDLNAASQGEMLSAMTSVEGSAGYVAIERVDGTLSGKNGSFVLQHFGMMAKGEGRLILEVVPDSGAGELVGLSGKMTLNNEDGQHFYEFEYELE